MVDCAASTLCITWHVFIWRGVPVVAFRWNPGDFYRYHLFQPVCNANFPNFPYRFEFGVIAAFLCWLQVT